MENLIPKENFSNRILIIDALRGFSLFGIMISHMAYLFGSYDFTKMSSPNPSIADIIVNIFNYLFISGKFFAIFSFLFGLSYFIQSDRSSKKGINYQWRFLWRILILIIIGYIHSLLYSGDILIIYGILGIPLVFLFRAKDKVLIVLIMLLLVGVPRFITYGINQLNSKPTNLVENKTRDKKETKNYEIYLHGSFKDVIKYNSVKGLVEKADYQFGVEGRIYQTFALFLLGLLVGRKRYFERIEENISLTRKILRRSIWFIIGFFIVSIGFFILSKEDDKSLSFQIAMTFLTLFNLTMALMITTAFITLYQRKKVQLFLIKLVPYGKMGLTNYTMQSIISIPLLYGFGLGLALHINLAIGLAIGIVIYIVQVKYSRLWLNNYLYGPLEWVWRSCTWLKWQPFLIKKLQ